MSQTISDRHMPTVFDRNLLPEFDSVKDDNEEILWIDKPNFVPYVLNGFGLAGGALVFFAIYYFGYINVKTDDGSMEHFNWVFAGLPIILFLWEFFRKILSYSNTRYAYTNKRVMMRTGFIGTDFKSIDYDKISDIEVTVNVVERLFNVGTIRFFSGRTEVKDDVTTNLYDRWEAIPLPYAVFKKVKQVSVDIKTDYTYPNALRPATNPGYNTQYDRP